MRNRRWIVAAVTAMAMLTGAGMLRAEEAALPTDNSADAEAANGGGAGGGVGMGETGVTVNSVTGWVVDAGGWLGMGFDGPEHLKDATASAQMGSPLVILTDKGSVVYPVMLTAPSSPKESNSQLIPYAGQHVTVAGKAIRRGREHGIVIETVAKTEGPDKPASFTSSETANVRLVARVTDLSCWVGRGERGAAHAACAQACAQAGEPLVLVSDSGYIYYPVTGTTPSGTVDNAILMNYCEKKVQVTGKVIERGRERAIVIDKVAAYVPMPKPGK
jgi:hypothetical protein